MISDYWTRLVIITWTNWTIKKKKIDIYLVIHFVMLDMVEINRNLKHKRQTKKKTSWKKEKKYCYSINTSKSVTPLLAFCWWFLLMVSQNVCSWFYGVLNLGFHWFFPCNVPHQEIYVVSYEVTKILHIPLCDCEHCYYYYSKQQVICLALYFFS